MDPEQLKKEFRSADRFVKVLSKDGKFRASAIKNTQTAKTAQQKHNLTHIPAYYLARAITCAQLIASFLKGEERIIIDIESNGPISKLYAEAIQVGEARGFANVDYDRLESEFSEIKDGLGIGLLRLIKMLYNRNEPQTGVTHLHKGDIASDLVYYFLQSEQIPTAIILDQDFDDNGLISESVGMIVQAMPGTGINDLQELVAVLEKYSKLIPYMNDERNPQNLLEVILPFEFDVLKNSRVDFFCRCSKERFIEKMITLGSDELQSMKNSGQNELVCKYCNSHYYLEEKDFMKILEDIQAGKN